MRLSLIILSLGIALQTGATPTGNEAAVMENIKERGCGTGNWCCTVANPSSYCIKYCAGGSKYINCGASYVSLSYKDFLLCASIDSDSSVQPGASANAVASMVNRCHGRTLVILGGLFRIMKAPRRRKFISAQQADVALSLYMWEAEGLIESMSQAKDMVILLKARLWPERAAESDQGFAWEMYVNIQSIPVPK
ncbi:hypothetical protein LIA77_05513 [Sarocladium implicatum]|nr:hypothetical protein LIA77_05513 [Sarocladium implicatum]